MSHIDGFVIPVPTDKKEAYRELAAKVAPIFIGHGATRLVECWGTDFRAPASGEPRNDMREEDT